MLFRSYYAYKKYKEAQDAKGNGTGNGTDSGQGAGTGTDMGTSALTNPNIRALQTWLEITPDGIAGKVTNGNAEYYWSNYANTFNADRMLAEGYPNLKKNGKGVVTESNAKYYLDTLKAAKSPRQLFDVSTAQSSSSASIIAQKTTRANAIKSAYTSGKVLKTNKAVTYAVVNYDNATKTYVSTGRQFSYSANVSFISPESFSSTGYVTIESINTSGNMVLFINPPLESSFKILVDPNTIIVV